jgi:hypothetical protein
MTVGKSGTDVNRLTCLVELRVGALNQLVVQVLLIVQRIKSLQTIKISSKKVVLQNCNSQFFGYGTYFTGNSNTAEPDP